MAYAAVISLKHTIERIKNPFYIPQITKPAYKELQSLVSMLKKLDDRSSRSIDRSVINDLDAKIRDAVWKLEDVLESSYDKKGAWKLEDVLKSSYDKKGMEQDVLESYSYDKEGVEQEIDLFLKTVNKLGEEYNRELLQKPLPAEEDDAPGSPMHDDFCGSNSTTVGLSDLYGEIINELVGGMHSLKTVSLVGMAGIGKTHLARQIFQHPLITRRFKYTLWASVGPKDEMKNIFVDFLAKIECKPKDLFKGKSVFELRDLILNNLCHQSCSYLIILDDIWDTQALDYFQLFPDYGNGSRFLLTTRLEEVAQYHSAKTIHQMPFLSNEESWNLLWQNVFGTEEYSFPSELEKAGRKIAEKCEGLPLLILAVANILRGLDKTEEYWEMVAEKKTTTFTDAYKRIYERLLSSYEYLPQRLKPCFLYMGVFPQSGEIPLFKLISLWAIEDFLDPSIDQSLEEFAVISLEDLVSNSLAIVCKRSYESVKRIKSCKLHSTYWYVCVTEARKNNFFHALIKLTDVISMGKPRRLSVQNNILLGINEVHDLMAEATSTTRSLLCTSEDHQYPVRLCLNMMLLKVLDALAIRFYEFPEEVVNLLQLRYLSLTHNGELPSSITNLQQLHCLILRRHHYIKFPTAPTTFLPKEIWDMKELRHLRITGRNLPEPETKELLILPERVIMLCKELRNIPEPETKFCEELRILPEPETMSSKELPNLSTLYVNARSCTKYVFKSIPHLKKLRIQIELQPDAAETLRCFKYIGVLKRLESLKCVVVNPRLKSRVVVPPDHLSNLPQGLKKLSLNGLGYSWKHMTAIGLLPNLQVLKLRCSAFQGAEWETESGQFQSLEFLLLEDLDLVHWTLKYKQCFGYLRHLIVRHCYKLKKIPSEIGEISTLKRMEVEDCSPAAVDSAHQIKKKKYSKFQLGITSSWK